MWDPLTRITDLNVTSEALTLPAAVTPHRAALTHSPVTALSERLIVT